MNKATILAWGSFKTVIIESPDKDLAVYMLFPLVVLYLVSLSVKKQEDIHSCDAVEVSSILFYLHSVQLRIIYS